MYNNIFCDSVLNRNSDVQVFSWKTNIQINLYKLSSFIRTSLLMKLNI